VFDPEPLNAIKSIKAVLAATVEKDRLEANFWEQADVPSPWNTHWTDAAGESGGKDINHPVFGQCWVMYRGLHFALYQDSNPEESWNLEGHNCIGAHSTVRHTAAATTTPKSLWMPLIVVVPPTQTSSEINP
jgi:hypothetical protein